MSKSVDQLVITLNKERDLYRDIHALSQKKRDAIKESDMEALEKITTEEQGLVVSLFKLEEIREKVIDLIMREEGIELVDNVSQLIDFLTYEDGVKLRKAKDELLVNIKNVSDETKFNHRLMEERLAMINLNIELMTQMTDDSGKYTKDAANEAEERRSLFDRRV